MSESTRAHIPLKRIMFLGIIVGAVAYYLSREQSRKALDAKLAELGLNESQTYKPDMPDEDTSE